VNFYVETKDIYKARGKKDPIGTTRAGRRKIAEGRWVPVSQPKQHTQKELLEKLASLGDKHAIAKLRVERSAPAEPRAFKGSVLQNKLKDKWFGAEIQSVKTGNKYRITSSNPIRMKQFGVQGYAVRETFALGADAKYKITKPGRKIKEFKYKGYKIRKEEHGFRVVDSSVQNDFFSSGRFHESKEGAKALVDKIIKEKKVKEKFLSKFSNPSRSIRWDGNSGSIELDRYRRHDHGGGESGDEWLDDRQIQEDFDQGVSEHGRKLKEFNKALSRAGYAPNAEFDLGEKGHEKGHFSIIFDIQKKTRAVRRSLEPSYVIKSRSHKYIRRIPKAKGFIYIYKETPKKKAITNDLAPPPPENRSFVKPGDKTTRDDVVRFISHFEADFKSLVTMDKTLKKAGATHFASRLKDSTSLLKKMHGRAKGQTLNQVADVIGARGLAKDLKDQKTMLKSIKGLKIVSIKDSSDKARADGYRAIHVSFKTPSGKIGELQIKTHRQQIFSGFTHDAIYKGPLEVKNDPDVVRYSRDLSNYLYDLDQGKAPGKRPETPESMKKMGIEFPWSLIDEFGTGAAAELSDKKVKFFAVVRDHETKENLRIVEFDNFKKAKAFRDADKYKHEIPLAYAKTKEEFLDAFTEYRPKDFKMTSKTKKSFGFEYLFIKADEDATLGWPEKRVPVKRNHKGRPSGKPAPAAPAFTISQYKSVGFVIDLLKAAGHKYIRKFKRNNKWIYTYHTERGARRLEEKDLNIMKELASSGDRGAKEVIDSIQAHDEKRLKILRELADRGDKHAVSELESLGIKREKERLEEELAFVATDELDKNLSDTKLNLARKAILDVVQRDIFTYLRGQSNSPYARAISEMPLNAITAKVYKKKSVRGMLTTLDEQLKKIDKAHRGLPPSQRNEIKTMGGYGNYAYKNVLVGLIRAGVLPPGYDRVHKRGERLPDPKKMREERERAERERKEKEERERAERERKEKEEREKRERTERERRKLGALTGSLAYHMTSMMPRRSINARDVIEMDNAIKGIFGKSLKKEDWPYDFSAQGFKVTLESVRTYNNKLKMDLSVNIYEPLRLRDSTNVLMRTRFNYVRGL